MNLQTEHLEQDGARRHVVNSPTHSAGKPPGYCSKTLKLNATGVQTYDNKNNHR